MKKYNPKVWEIELECPQCGAPVILEETDHLFSCSYCRTRLYLISQDYFRYYLPPSDAFRKEIIFVPYWRFKGIGFFCQTNNIVNRVIDFSSIALLHSFLPPSLGFRSQALKLRFVSPEMEGTFFKSQVPLNTIIENIEKQLICENPSTDKLPLSPKAFIGDTVSTIYSPILFKGNKAIDAITGRPVGSLQKGFLEDPLLFDQGNWQLQFIPTLCPQCGWDLLGERDSVVLLCRNCDSAWEASKQGLKGVNFGIVPSKKEEDEYYFPFWAMKVQVDGLQLQSYADLLRFANVPKVLRKEDEEADFYFWVPAFKAPPELFLRLAKGITLSQSREPIERMLPDSPLFPVTLPLREGGEGIKISIGNIAIDKKNLFPKLKEIQIQLKESLLTFIPFHLIGQEFIHTQTQCAIHRNQLKLGRNL